jgi:ribosomal protein S18 acetylase RimI-like enzyme
VVPIRRATPEDAPEIVRVINLAYRVEDFFIDGDRTNTDDIRVRLSRPHGVFLVADASEAGGLAAAVYVEVRGDRGYFGMLAVDPAYQQRGLGRALAVAAESHCAAAGCRDLDIDVVDLRTELPDFYRVLGFSPVGTAPFPDPHKLRRPAHLITMSKPLAAN